MIGQRLYTGRVAVAQAALAYRSQLFDVTKAYADAKPVPAPRTHPSGVPPPPPFPPLVVPNTLTLTPKP